jgi:hypothetical protein
MSQPDQKTTLDPRVEALLRSVVRDCIDIGARCQKARTWMVAEAGKPAVSVYDAATERVLMTAREALSHEQD